MNRSKSHFSGRQTPGFTDASKTDRIRICHHSGLNFYGRTAPIRKLILIHFAFEMQHVFVFIVIAKHPFLPTGKERN